MTTTPKDNWAEEWADKIQTGFLGTDGNGEIKLIAQALLEAEQRGWKRGMEEAAVIVEREKLSENGNWTWNRGMAAIADKIRSASEKERKA